ncbi:MAG: ABC transporter permease [Ethanoligenens sp.]|uniref:ABC transporter permease n=1 Tax=Ethanoligenens sp. TaxID=2099655 RepID=UPI0039EC194B
MSRNKKSVGVRECLGDSFTPRTEISGRSYIILAVAMFGIVLAIWSIATYSGMVNVLFVPTPGKTLQAAVKLFTQLDYISDIRITVIRVMVGFLIAAVIALPLGVLVGTYRPLEALIEPLTSFARYLPASAFVPLFILWIGVGEGAKFAVIIVGSLPQLLLMVAVDTRKVQHDLIEVSYTLGVSKSSVLWKVILPGSMPSIMDSLRMVLGWAWTYVVVAELIGASSGIGYMIIQSQRMLNTSNIFVGILSIGVIGLVFDFVLKWLNRVLFRWN